MNPCQTPVVVRNQGIAMMNLGHLWGPTIVFTLGSVVNDGLYDSQTLTPWAQQISMKPCGSVMIVSQKLRSNKEQVIKSRIIN